VLYYNGINIGERGEYKIVFVFVSFFEFIQ
jgi:hypothetical protein